MFVVLEESCDYLYYTEKSAKLTIHAWCFNGDKIEIVIGLELCDTIQNVQIFYRFNPA